MERTGTMARMRVLNKEQVARTLTMGDTLKGVESIYVAKAEGQTDTWPTVFSIFEEGVADVDIKSGWLRNDHLFGHKTASLFVENPGRGLDSLQAVINVYSSDTGEVVGIVSAGQITGMRTGAAGALGAKWLARKDSRQALVCGAGNQALYQTAGLIAALPQVDSFVYWDRHERKAQAFAKGVEDRMQDEFGLDAEGRSFLPADDLESAVRQADIIVTCTPATAPYIKSEWVQPGTHISAVGADAEGKQELESAIAGRALVFVDDVPHCMEAGEVERPLKEGVITPDDIAGELGEVIRGTTEGRTSDEQVTLYDTAGLAVLDIAAAKTALDAAARSGVGTVIDGM